MWIKHDMFKCSNCWLCLFEKLQLHFNSSSPQHQPQWLLWSSCAAGRIPGQQPGFELEAAPLFHILHSALRSGPCNFTKTHKQWCFSINMGQRERTFHELRSGVALLHQEAAVWTSISGNCNAYKVMLLNCTQQNYLLAQKFYIIDILLAGDIFYRLTWCLALKPPLLLAQMLGLPGKLLLCPVQ